MKSIFWLILTVLLLFALELMKTYKEGLCGAYSLPYSKVKDIFNHSDISGIQLAFNTHYTNDLIRDCL
jgi:hypothetical protein